MAQDRLVEEIVLLALFLVSTAGNSLALLVFYRRPGLRTVSNRFVINLLATNLVTTSLLAPALLGEYSGRGAAWVEAGDTAAAACSVVALLAVTLVAVDQHHAVTDPLRCHTRLLQRRPAALCAATWLAAAAAAAPRVALAAARLAYPAHPAVAAAKLAYYAAYLVAVLAPVSVVCVMYSRIYRAARSSGLRARANGASAPHLAEPTINLPDLIEESDGLTLRIDVPESADGEHKFGTFLVPPEAPTRCPSVGSLRGSQRDGRAPESLARSLPAVSSAPSLAAPLLCTPRPPAPGGTGSKITSIRYRISNASLFRYREESRAARVGLLTGALVALHVPHALAALLAAVAPETGVARAPALALLLLASAACPFLFALRSRRVQREARRMFLPQKSGWERGAAAAVAAAADGQRARSALELLRALSPREGEAARSSFSSGGSTQVSSASDE